jgi:hypothetical protein
MVLSTVPSRSEITALIICIFYREAHSLFFLLFFWRMIINHPPFSVFLGKSALSPSSLGIFITFTEASYVAYFPLEIFITFAEVSCIATSLS